jgi:hypothetical protein
MAHATPDTSALLVEDLAATSETANAAMHGKADGACPRSAEEFRASCRWTLVGTNTGPGGTGRRVRISGFEEWTIGDDGLIAASHPSRWRNEEGQI